MFLQKLKNALLKGRERTYIDPTVFNDPVAESTEWGPAKRGGSNFRTHKLIPVGGQRMEFKGTVGGIIFGMIFMIAGIGALVGFSVFMSRAESTEFEIPMIIPYIFGTIFVLVGFFIYRSMTAPVVFDKSLGYFWKGRKSPREVVNVEQIKVYSELDQIHAIQLLSEYCHTDKSHYYSYELNLIMKDGSRINVIDHGNLAKVKEDADSLAQFLEVPVWDGIR